MKNTAKIITHQQTKEGLKMSKIDKEIEQHLDAIKQLKKKLQDEQDKENVLIGALVRQYAEKDADFGATISMLIDDAPARTKKALSNFQKTLPAKPIKTPEF